jgi:hypothetical protein
MTNLKVRELTLDDVLKQESELERKKRKGKRKKKVS